MQPTHGLRPHTPPPWLQLLLYPPPPHPQAQLSVKVRAWQLVASSGAQWLALCERWSWGAGDRSPGSLPHCTYAVYSSGPDWIARAYLRTSGSPRSSLWGSCPVAEDREIPAQLLAACWKAQKAAPSMIYGTGEVSKKIHQRRERWEWGKALQLLEGRTPAVS